MRNWKMIGAASLLVIVGATAAALAYAPTGGGVDGTLQNLPARHAAVMSYAASHKDVIHTRVAQSCIAHNGVCVVGGTACCNAADHCTGTFPNTYCQ